MKKTWKVVMGLPLVRVAPEDKPEPRIAAAIAELMEGPRDPITWTKVNSVSEIMEEDNQP